MKKAIYPGSFDPMTYGHLDIIRRASEMFDELVVGVLVNNQKTPLFSTDERVKIFQETTVELPNVKVVSFSGLLCDYCLQNEIHVCVRGLRAITDFEYELQLSQTNRMLSDGKLDTIYLNTSLQYSYLSSSTVKEIASFGGDLSRMVPDRVAEMLQRKFDQ
jgi:pantetheine-phosphate adenylyltransferase